MGLLLGWDRCNVGGTVLLKITTLYVTDYNSSSGRSTVRELPSSRVSMFASSSGRLRGTCG